MALWTDIATWIGPTVNRTINNMSTIHGIVLHIQEGSEAGTEAWQRNPASQVSSHFLAPKAGGGKQMVDTADKAWCEVAGNAYWLSVECEGWTGDSLTPTQIEFVAQLLARAHTLHNVPLVVTDDPGGFGLGWHGMGGTAWGGHFDCPGEPIKAQRPQIAARAAQIVAGNIMTDLDFGPWARPEGLGNRPAAVELADVWFNEMFEAGPYGSGQVSTRTARLQRIEAKLDKALAALDLLAKAVSTLTPSAGIKPGAKVSLTVDSVVP